MAFLSLLKGQSTRVQALKVKIKELNATEHPVHVYQSKQSEGRLSRDLYTLARLWLNSTWISNSLIVSKHWLHAALDSG